MSNRKAEPTLAEDGMLWQLLKGYANEDWDRRAAPWPAPANACLSECSRGEARALAEELERLAEACRDDAAWRALLLAAHVDAAALAPPGRLPAWADDLRARARAAACG